jgi:hypothetical protein
VIGVHTPEFAFEKDFQNVKNAVKDLGVTYPVAIDNDYAIWNAFQNLYWPAHYFIDREGKIRHHHFGEGNYEESEKVLQELLGEKASDGLVEVQSSGAQAGSNLSLVRSPETYVGSARSENRKDSAKNLALNEWALTGNWAVGSQEATLQKAPGKITFRFHARDLHLVLGPGTAGKEISFRVTLDGKAPGKDHGMDIDAKGFGKVRENRLYQLLRQENTQNLQDRTFEIEFLDPGVQAFAFTFG